jgi:hypothetical protein
MKKWEKRTVVNLGERCNRHGWEMFWPSVAALCRQDDRNAVGDHQRGGY